MGPIDIKIATVANSFLNSKYHLGPAQNGYDCLTLLRSFYGAFDVQLPSLPDGWTDGNYAERWKAGEGRSEFSEYLNSIGVAVDANFALAGDIFIFNGAKWVFPGIYLGSGNMLCAFEQGCKVVPLKLFKQRLIGVRRCLR